MFTHIAVFRFYENFLNNFDGMVLIAYEPREFTVQK